FFSSRRRHKISKRDWSSDVCSSDLRRPGAAADRGGVRRPVPERGPPRRPAPGHPPQRCRPAGAPARPRRRRGQGADLLRHCAPAAVRGSPSRSGGRLDDRSRAHPYAAEHRAHGTGDGPRPMTEAATEQFLAHRNLLFTVVYEVLGSAADAEDVLQETWLRWAGTDTASIREPRAYLVRIATRLALNRLRTLSRRKETYIGCWLPEPVLTTPDVAEDV